MTDNDQDTIEVPEEELYELYCTLMDATEAASSGDPNECARLTAEAKQDLADLYEEWA